MRIRIHLMLALGLFACECTKRNENMGAAGHGGSSPGLDAEGRGDIEAGIGDDAEPGTDGRREFCPLPSRYQWTSSEPIIVPVSDPSHDLIAIKDPSVVFFNGRWHVYASSVSSTGVYAMVYASFTDLSDASSGTFYHMDRTPGFATYVAAPQLFYFAPQRRWYLVFQSGPPMYATNDDPGKPEAWTRPAPFFSSEPPIITQNGGWLDFWVICDDARCHLFFSNDHGRWYRSVTGVADFPRGFSEPTVVMEDREAGRLYEGSSVHRLRGAAPRYLALIEAFDATSSWRRYFRSWTAESLDGPWLPQKDSGKEPFAASSNVTFAGQTWTKDISHGELIRDGYDQTLTLDPCDLRLLYQGYDPIVPSNDYNKIPWKLGLLTLVR